MTPKNNQGLGDKQLVVRRGRVDSVDLYEIKDNELDLLEKGSPANLQLNFAIFLTSLAFSSILALCTSTFKFPIMETVFVVIAVVGVLLGGYLLFSWWRTRTSITKLIQIIKNRIPTDVSEELAEQPSTKSVPKSDIEPAG